MPHALPPPSLSPLSPPPHRIVLLAAPPVQTLDVTGPLEVFSTANILLAHAGQALFYALTLAGPTLGAVASSCGVDLLASAAFLTPGLQADTLVIAGGVGARAASTDVQQVAWLRGLCERTPRVASVCTGAFWLAATGCLDGRGAATHWGYCAAFKQRFAQVQLDPNAIFVSDGKFHSSAGVTAGIDLALALVEHDLGSHMALEVARELVVFLKRPGGQSQFSTRLMVATTARPERFGALLDWMHAHLAHDLSV